MRKSNWPLYLLMAVMLGFLAWRYLYLVSLERLKFRLTHDDPHQVALAAQEGNYTLIATLHSGGRQSLPIWEIWGVSCVDMPPPYIGPFETDLSKRFDQSDTSINWNNVAEFNRMMVMMPNFPSLAQCPAIKKSSHNEFAIEHGIKDGASSYILNMQFLKDLHMSEEQYNEARRKLEKSSIEAAAYFGHIDVLSSHINDLNTCNSNYHYPMYYAEKGGHKEVVDFLVQHGGERLKVDCYPQVGTTF